MRAIIADIHANLEALRVVLKEVNARKVDEVVCLGDIIGYGPDPVRCLDAAMRFTWSLMGNHEEGLLFPEQGERYSERARASLDWTRGLLEDPGNPANGKRWDFLGELPDRKIEGDVIYVHGSPRRPRNEYIKPSLAADRAAMEELFATFEHVAFVSHTHWPGAMTLAEGWRTPSELGNEYTITDEKVIVNVGAVGQPRDGNPRACLCLFDGQTVIWRRIQYNVEATQSKILANPELDDSLAERLAEGR